MRRDQMPDLVEGTEVSGRLRPALAAELGLPAGIPVWVLQTATALLTTAFSLVGGFEGPPQAAGNKPE